MYWVLWLLMGGMFEGLFCAFVLSETVKKTFDIIKGEYSFKTKLLRLALMSVTFAFTLVVLVFIIATFVYRASNGFYIGSDERVRAIIGWPFYFFLLTPIIFIAIFSIRVRDFKVGLGATDQTKPIRKKIVWVRPSPIRSLWIAIFVFLVATVLAASICLAMPLNYVLIKLFTVAWAKKVLLVFVTVEIVVLLALAICFRKKFKWFSTSKYIAPAVLFALLIGCLILFTTSNSRWVDEVFMWIGATAFIFILVAGVIVFAFYRCRLKTASKNNETKGKIIKKKERS